MKAYDFIKRALEKFEGARNSDKNLAWYFWQKEGTVVNGIINVERFRKATSFETVRRTRAKVVQHHPHLGPTIESVRIRRGVQKKGQLYNETIDTL